MQQKYSLSDEALRRPLSAPSLEVQSPVRVLLADDSSLVRNVLRTALTAAAPAVSIPMDCRVEICGMARDGIECLAAVRSLSPDLLILDIEMPRMDGLTVLTHLKEIAPDLPVIMFSALTAGGARATFEALTRGAADYVTKPTQQADVNSSIADLQRQLLPKIAGLTRSPKRKVTQPPEPYQQESGASRLGPTAGPVSTLQLAALPSNPVPLEAILIGVSTGGPSALEKLLPQLPQNFPIPILVVQHMPAIYSEMLAQRLNSSCRLKVREAVDAEIIRPGTVWIAKGDWHMKLQRCTGAGREVHLHLEQSEMEQYSRPSVDVLFRSAVEIYGAGAMGVVMTGMGSDGATGALSIYRRGGSVLAQDEASSAVWGMPKRAMELGSVYKCLNIDGIAAELLRRVMPTEAKHAL